MYEWRRAPGGGGLAEDAEPRRDGHSFEPRVRPELPEDGAGVGPDRGLPDVEPVRPSTSVQSLLHPVQHFELAGTQSVAVEVALGRPRVTLADRGHETGDHGL